MSFMLFHHKTIDYQTILLCHSEERSDEESLKDSSLRSEYFPHCPEQSEQLPLQPLHSHIFLPCFFLRTK